MKTNWSDQFNRSKIGFLFSIMVLIIVLYPAPGRSQHGYNISGELISTESGKAIAFANVALSDTAKAGILGGAASNEAGIFNINNIVPGTYYLLISALGYESHLEKVALSTSNVFLGAIGMSEKNLELKDVEVVAERIKAKQAADNTTFFINRKMQESSNTGTDILRLLPGVGVDLQQNISLEGSQNIILLVDGKERDRSFMSRLPASKIDKVEIISSPPAKYDAGVTGVINVLLTKERTSGLEGNVYAEIPVSTSEAFLTPAYSLNYGFGKINLYTSYNGDIRRFNITETYRRKILNPHVINEIALTQALRQNTWSHRFHYGLDWYINDRNQLNLYGFWNPFSQEHDGTAEVTASGTERIKWQAEKNDEDINRSWFNSLWYKHLFDKTTGHEITLETSWYSLYAENSTTWTDIATGFISKNRMQPDNRAIHVRLEYMLPVSESIKLSSGFQARHSNMRDKSLETFRYNETNYAGYGIFSYKHEKLETNLGLRIEHLTRQLADRKKTTGWNLLPDVSAKYSLGATQSLAINYRRSLSYPGFYQLNPSPSMEDLFTLSTGNPGLQPEKINRIHLEYSRRFKNHFLSTKLFCQNVSDAIGKLMSVNEEGHFEIQQNNLGEIYQVGIQFSGALGFGKAGINPYVKVFDAWSVPNRFAKQYQPESRHQLAVETGLSAYATFGNDFTASATFQYFSPVNDIQGTSFSGALYFLSLEKSFTKNLKAGIVSGVPLVKNFIYQGYQVNNSNFSHYSKGELNVSALPLWIKINYQFASGRKRQKIERANSAPEREIRKGF